MPLPSPRKAAALVKRVAHRSWAYAYVAAHVRHVSGPKHIPRTLGDCVTVSVVRDCEDYIDTFIRYYQTLGVRHIFILDNGSEDSTLERAAGHEGVTVIACHLPYKKFKNEMRQFLADRYSLNQWCITADCDEFLDYPLSDHVSLDRLIVYLEENGYQAVLTQMLDMYPKGAIADEIPVDQFRQHHRWFELDSIQTQPIPAGLENTVPNSDLKLHYGGVRQRAFSANPLISKFALLKPNFARQPVGHHLLSWAKIADFSAILYHYKFLPSFSKTVERAIREQQYYQGSQEYKKYQDSLAETQNLTLFCDASLELNGPDQLVDLDFLTVSSEYRKFATGVETT